MLMLEVFGVFQERERKYHSLWKQYGAVDSYHHVTSKAARTQFYLEGIEDESDPFDLVNYTLFLIRNMRSGRIHRELGDSAKVVEAWRVVDRWWTEEPAAAEYRVVELSDGSRCTQRRTSEDEQWVQVVG